MLKSAYDQLKSVRRGNYTDKNSSKSQIQLQGQVFGKPNVLVTNSIKLDPKSKE